MTFQNKQKIFWKIQHPFIIKTFYKLGTDENFLNLIKTIYKNPRANITFNIEKLEAFTLKSSTKMDALT